MGDPGLPCKPSTGTGGQADLRDIEDPVPPHLDPREEGLERGLVWVTKASRRSGLCGLRSGCSGPPALSLAPPQARGSVQPR